MFIEFIGVHGVYLYLIFAYLFIYLVYKSLDKHKSLKLKG